MKISRDLFPFLVVSLLHLLSLGIPIDFLIPATKLLIMVSLMHYFYKSVGDSPINKLVIFAMVCSLIGDAALMYQEEASIFFMVGLGFFLLAHIGYAFINFNLVNDDQRKIKIYWQDIPIIIAGFAVFLLIKDGVGDLRIPVLSYIVVITFMAITA